MLKKRMKILSYIIILFAVAMQASVRFEFVNPKPTICRQKRLLVCACSSGAMIMKYWAKVGVVTDKNCETYQKEFRHHFGTTDGSVTNSERFIRTLDPIMFNNYISQKEMEHPITKKLGLWQYWSIRKHLLHHQLYPADLKSPWDRPIVIWYFRKHVMIRGNKLKNFHSVVGYGCGKKWRKILLKKYVYKVLDPDTGEDDVKVPIPLPRDWNPKNCAFLIWPEKKVPCSTN
jgi:hypothetical protein